MGKLCLAASALLTSTFPLEGAGSCIDCAAVAGPACSSASNIRYAPGTALPDASGACVKKANRREPWRPLASRTSGKPSLWYYRTPNHGPDHGSAMSVLGRSGLTRNVRRNSARVSHADCRLLSACGAWHRPKPPRAARRPPPRRLARALAAFAARSSAPPRQHKRNMPLPPQVASHGKERATA